MSGGVLRPGWGTKAFTAWIPPGAVIALKWANRRARSLRGRWFKVELEKTTSNLRFRR